TTHSFGLTIGSNPYYCFNSKSEPHLMFTRFRVGTNRPTKRYTCHVSPISPLSKSYTHVFNDPYWYCGMLDEYNALIKNKTWILVPRPHNVNIVRCLWLFGHKHNADGSLNRYKARLVGNGSSQLAGIDVGETFSPVVKPATIRTVPSLAISRHWPVNQLDIKNAFLNGYLSKTVYMHQPLGADIAYLLLYVDDIVLTASATAFLQRIITSLYAEFSMTDLVPFNYFLSVVILPGCFPLNRSMLLSFTRPRPLLWLLIQMRIGLVVSLHIDLLLAIVFFLAIIFFLGRPRDSLPEELL
nr:ribonuclease H-like domain-containing protein [Tanacetum cinerariifolium]